MEAKAKKCHMPVALVTGGTHGLGKQVVLALAKQGYTVVLNYRHAGAEAEGLTEAPGISVFPTKADIGNLAQVEEMAFLIEKEFGRLDAVINNAGITKDNLLLRQTEQEWDEIINTNLRGCFNIIRTMAPLMIKSGGGHIINISSYSGVKGKAGQAAYSASKAALLGLATSSAIELAEYNIRVNAILPGYMRTEMGMKADKAMEKAKGASILGRLSEPGDVAEFIVYLLKTKNVTGQVFSLDSRIL